MFMIRNILKLWACLTIVFFVSACDKTEESAYQPTYSSNAENTNQIPEYIVGIHPLHNPQKLMELYGPIVDYMNSHIPEAHFKLEASRNYEEFEKKLYAGNFAFAMPNPYQTYNHLSMATIFLARWVMMKDFEASCWFVKTVAFKT